MDNLFTKICFTALLTLGVSFSAWSIVINDSAAGSKNNTTVGLIDLLLAEDDTKGNPAAELAWVNSVISPSSTTYLGIKTANVNYYQTDTSNVFAFELVSEPGYYILKNATRVALYKNENDYGWGVFDLSLLSSSMNLSARDDLVISHVTEFGNTTRVSEPATLGLLGLGLLGLSLSRRRVAK